MEHLHTSNPADTHAAPVKSKLKTVVDWSSASAFSGALAHRQLTHFNGSSPTSSEETLIPGFSCKHIVFKLSNDHNFGCHLLYIF